MQSVGLNHIEKEFFENPQEGNLNTFFKDAKEITEVANRDLTKSQEYKVYMKALQVLKKSKQYQIKEKLQQAYKEVVDTLNKVEKEYQNAWCCLERSPEYKACQQALQAFKGSKEYQRNEKVIEVLYNFKTTLENIKNTR